MTKRNIYRVIKTPNIIHTLLSWKPCEKWEHHRVRSLRGDSWRLKLIWMIAWHCISRSVLRIWAMGLIGSSELCLLSLMT